MDAAFVSPATSRSGLVGGTPPWGGGEGIILIDATLAEAPRSRGWGARLFSQARGRTPLRAREGGSGRTLLGQTKIRSVGGRAAAREGGGGKRGGPPAGLFRVQGTAVAQEAEETSWGFVPRTRQLDGHGCAAADKAAAERSGTFSRDDPRHGGGGGRRRVETGTDVRGMGASWVSAVDVATRWPRGCRRGRSRGRIRETAAGTPPPWAIPRCGHGTGRLCCGQDRNAREGHFAANQL